MKLALVFTVVLPLSARTPEAKTMLDVEKINSKVHETFEKKWKIVSQTASKSWLWRRTPPFPMSWPKDGSVLQFYAYATRFGIFDGITDGETIGRIWGVVDVDLRKPEQLEFSELAKPDAKRDGQHIQGVRPLRPDEIKAFELEPLKLFDEQDNSGLKTYYCAWLGTNGVVASLLKDPHRSFFKWLACPGFKVR